MLTALSIRDIVLIEKLDIALDKGLTVLTGETGAGKSIVLDALGLALGGRADVYLREQAQEHTARDRRNDKRGAGPRHEPLERPERKRLRDAKNAEVNERDDPNKRRNRRVVCRRPERDDPPCAHLRSTP